ncbi:hypothetical protein ACRALDRAFT_1062330 [Sodiomyces alcalophilus JCM 7366]|uniref:uncharacterized protein n=1 Tax=Sodiomyces alcalophilus JCM 7366 TaxID=591952 RepID=UPI0039B6D48E
MQVPRWVHRPLAQCLTPVAHNQQRLFFSRPKFLPTLVFAAKSPVSRPSQLLSSLGRLMHLPSSLTSPRSFTTSASFHGFHGSRRSEAEILQEHLGEGGKWGFVVYRTTYGDDDGWNRVKETIQASSMRGLKAPDLASSLDWVFMDDKDTLDGISRPELRRLFREWAHEAFKREGHRHRRMQIPETVQDSPEAEPRTVYRTVPMLGANSRYIFFIEVDAESLRSIVYDRDPSDPWDLGHVNFINSEWEPQGPPESEEERLAMLDDEPLPPIDGCTDEDVGWMKLKTSSLGISFHLAATYYVEDTWHYDYKRPPAIVDWT